ncbi:hypothetical protein GWE18_15145 [Bradyrhizobium sp. CSA112]|nr:hypothetical protein [Bradyrhizobium sp. CSA112]MDE5454163.1 hypothetical protein [Bradyrhizobium sp. CSA112]
MAMPTKFIAERAQQDFGLEVLAYCSALVPTVRADRMVVAKSSGVAA